MPSTFRFASSILRNLRPFLPAKSSASNRFYSNVVYKQALSASFSCPPLNIPWRWLSLGIAGSLFATLSSEAVFADALLMRDTLELIKDPSTRLEVPRRLHLHGQQFQLLGVGARQVSFLRINVYTVAMYATKLMPLNSLLQSDLLLYITPTRPAELSHLRDGFIKHLKKGNVDPDQIQAFASLFPKVRIMKGHALILEKHSQGLSVYFDGEKLGDVASASLAEALFHAYLKDSPVSPKLLNNMKENCNTPSPV